MFPGIADADNDLTDSYQIKARFLLLFSQPSAILVSSAIKNAFCVFTRKELRYETLEN